MNIRDRLKKEIEKYASMRGNMAAGFNERLLEDALAEIEAVEQTRDIDVLVNLFLAWPLPDSVCADLIATITAGPHRSGTNLLTAIEARQMFEYVLCKVTK